MIDAKIAAAFSASTVGLRVNTFRAASFEHGSHLATQTRKSGSNNATGLPPAASTSCRANLPSPVQQRVLGRWQQLVRSSYKSWRGSSRYNSSHLPFQTSFMKGGSIKQGKYSGEASESGGGKESNDSNLRKLCASRKRRHGQCTCAMGPPQLGAGRRPYTIVMIVPTGVGATIGGYAGDALPVARTLASLADCLITHPNVLNGAMMYWPIANALYVEGYGLDQFAMGRWGLRPVHQNRIGIVFDAAIEEDLRLRHLQVADAAQATLGLSLADYIITDMPLQVEKWVDPRTGASTGRLGRPDSLMRAVRKLTEGDAVDAVAVIGRFPDDSVSDLEEYRQGQGVDALAGVEAVISHMVVKEFCIPCAHAPALLPLPLEPVSPRSAAEEIGYTFLPCVLAGLSRAPQFVQATGTISQDDDAIFDDAVFGRGTEGREKLFMGHQPISSSKDFSYSGGPPSRSFRPASNRCQSDILWSEDVDAVVVPGDACGGDGTLAFSWRKGWSKPLLIAVEENETVMDDTPSKLQLDAVIVKNYWEAAGVIAAHRAGVNPMSLRKNGVTSVKNREDDGIPRRLQPDFQYRQARRVMVNSH